MEGLLNLAPCPAADFEKPVIELLREGKIVRLEGTDPTRLCWVVAGRLEKRAVIGYGIPFERVWTVTELQSAGVELTLAGVMRALGFSPEDSLSA